MITVDRTQLQTVLHDPLSAAHSRADPQRHLTHATCSAAGNTAQHCDVLCPRPPRMPPPDGPGDGVRAHCGEEHQHQMFVPLGSPRAGGVVRGWLGAGKPLPAQGVLRADQRCPSLL
jgi:hypothetical protein